MHLLVLVLAGMKTVETNRCTVLIVETCQYFFYQNINFEIPAIQYSYLSGRNFHIQKEMRNFH